MITDRIDAITKIPETHRAAFLPAPKSVKIELTGRCNYRCGFCALRNREVQPHGDMDWSLFTRVTRDMKISGVREIGVFYLGESLMAKDLTVAAIEFLKHALEFEYVFLTTNASLLDESTAERIMAAGLDSLKYSVNAASAEQFAEIMGVSPKYFFRALDNIESTWRVREKHGFKTRLYASSIRYDGAQLERMEQLLDTRVRPFCDQTYWLPLYSMGAQANQREAELGYTPTAGNQGRIGALREPLPCWSCFMGAHLTADGILTACCFDADGRFAMADLNHVPFMDGWNSDKFQALRAAHLARDVTGTICQDCVAYR